MPTEPRSELAPFPWQPGSQSSVFRSIRDGNGRLVADVYGGQEALVLAACNACAQINPDNPLAVAKAMVGMARALQWNEVMYTRPGESFNATFERIGEVFKRETGYLSPGKDCRIHSPEERQSVWDKWREEHLAKTRTALTKAGLLP